MSNLYNPPKTQDANIAQTETDSQAIRVTAGIVAGIRTPAALTSTAITFEGCEEVDGTFSPVYDSDGNQVSLAAAADRCIGLSGAEADALAPWPYIKLICGSAEGADRVIKVILR